RRTTTVAQLERRTSFPRHTINAQSRMIRTQNRLGNSHDTSLTRNDYWLLHTHNLINNPTIRELEILVRPALILFLETFCELLNQRIHMAAHFRVAKSLIMVRLGRLRVTFILEETQTLM
ncbi:hypothetical protein A2U01_0060161, partial [Trifolium medium]|nr:hypothetical protein [Trifolium medium]